MSLGRAFINFCTALLQKDRYIKHYLEYVYSVNTVETSD